MQDAYSDVLDGQEGHTPKSCCPLRSFTFCVPALLLQFQAQ